MALTAKKVYAILKRQISDMEAKLNSPVRYRGTVATADLLPLNPDIGDMYNIESKSIYGEAGMNVAWNGVVWDTMGAPIDMSLYIKSSELADWVKQQNKPTYTAEEIGALPADTKIPSKTSDLQNDSGFLTKIPDNYLSGTDKTLSVSGKAADAKATGDKITELSADISNKLNKNQGSENSGKIAGINESGDIVPMFPVSVDYNEETNCLEFGSDQKMELNKGINLDSTLTKTGYAADAGAVGEITNSLKEDIGNLSTVKIGENKCTNKNEVYNSTIYLPVYLEKSKSYIIYNPTSETLKGCAINVVNNSEKDSILITVKPMGWVIPNPKDKTQSFLSTVDDGWYKIKLSYQSVFTEEQKAMYGTGWMVKEIPTVDYVPTSFDYVEYKESILAKESVNAEKANYAEKAGSIVQKEENVACIGDSLTYGYGASPGSTDYPTVLTKLCGKTVYNLGVSGESTDEILARQGGFPAIINPVNIPTETNTVEITFSSNINIGSNNTVLLRKASNNLVNPVVIDGVEGNISASNNKYYFTRLEDGTAHEIKHPQYVITKEMREHKDDIQIIFMGTNGGWMITADDAETRIKKLTSQIDMMIDYNTSKKYIIIGMHYFYSWVLYNGLTKEQLENAMLLKYGNHYINLRKYMIEYGLADAGLTATEADTEAINNGNVPPSLLYSDGVHGNAYFYNILANLVNKKGIELGYWN